jgi:kinesin family protein 4/21/27
MTTSQVRVALRLRPLTPLELSTSTGTPILTTTSTTVTLSRRTFTYDAVYDNLSQIELYADVSSPLLQAFLGGYNATVLAYGQTGSGKTYTMGSDASYGEEEEEGLIPRFMRDIFAALERRKEECGKNESLEYSMDATYLEVYGEDIHDLLDEDRKSLPIREDSNGQVVVVGLRSKKVQTNQEAMAVLNTGTMNRTTAATLMNVTSSRSHAVFTVNLRQVARGADAVDVVTSSRFTFVDLAGSERMKKTGAEGERMKEGIRINEGLLALGNVINALADEERLSKGEKVHVPYRQSKLTRLLQDALGGNSQTLFLACASPSDTNASETLSTLQYANRARNIKNRPTKNVDAAVLELQNLRALTNVLKCELIKKSFGRTDEKDALGEVDDGLLQRADVLEYMTAIDEKVAEVTGCNAVSTYPVSVSSVVRAAAPVIHSSSSSHLSRVSIQSAATATLHSNSGKEDDATLVFDVDPDEDMKILDELLELQHRDHQFNKDQQHGQEQLDSMEGEIDAHEERLNKLRENLIMYHNIKVKYERLICEVDNLEAEKQALADALEKAQVDPTKGCSKAIKRKLQEVEESLARARSDTRRHQQKLRQAEQESQKLKVLERKIQDLKHAKVNLMKKQKEESAKHKEFTYQKTREINALKRKEKTAEKKMSKMEGENQMFRHNLERSRAQNDKLSDKLKQTETHLMRLLTERRNNMSRNTSSRRSKVHAVDIQGFEGSDKFAPADSQEVNSLKFLLEKSVGDRVNLMQQLNAYEAKVVEHGKLLQSMASEVKMMNKQRGHKSDASIKEHEDNIHEYQLKLELVESDLEQLRAKFPRVEEYYFEEDETKKQLREILPALKIISKIDAPTLRTLFWEFLEGHVKSEVCCRELLLCYKFRAHSNNNVDDTFFCAAPTAKPQRRIGKEGINTP